MNFTQERVIFKLNLLPKLKKLKDLDLKMGQDITK